MKLKYLLSMAVLFLVAFHAGAQNVGIGTSSPNAALDVSATNNGILIPRIALTGTGSASPLTSPAASTMVYNTATVTNVTPGYYYWSGTAWIRLIDNGSLSGSTTVSNTSSANTLSTTVNGVTGATVPMVNSIGNTSSANTLSTTVNGVTGTGVNIINSNALSLTGNNLTATINGLGSSAQSLSGLTLAGDVTGTLGASTVGKIQGIGVAISSLVTSNLLQYNGTNWVNVTPASVLSAATTHTLSLTGNTLTSTVNGVASAQSLIGLSISGDVTGTLANSTVGRIQGTGVVISSLAANNLLQYNGTNWVNVAPGSALFTAGTGLGWSGSTLNNTGVTSAVAGTGIGVSSATGAVTFTNTGVLSFSGGATGLTPASATTGAVTLAGTLGVANGGTGDATLATGGILYGNGTGAVQVTPAPASGQLLLGNTTTPSFQTMSGDATISNTGVLSISATPTSNGYIKNQITANQPAGFRITGNGYFNGGVVGIGTVAPGEALSVYQPMAGWQGHFSNSYSPGADVYLAHGGGYGMHIRGWSTNDGIYALQIYNSTSELAAFWESGRTVLGEVGNVGIGTTGPNGKLDIYNPGANGDGAVFAPDITMDNNFTIQTYIDATAGGGWANRTTYAGTCCNNLALQPDAGTVSVGGVSGNYGANKFNVIGNSYIQNTLSIGSGAAIQSYGNIALNSGLNGWNGILYGPSTAFPCEMYSGGTGGLYYQNYGWETYYTPGDHDMSINYGGDLGYTLGVGGTLGVTGTGYIGSTLNVGSGAAIQAYGNIALNSGINAWNGILFGPSAGWPCEMYNAGNGGVYYQNRGSWAYYINGGNSYMGVGTSNTSYPLTVNGDIFDINISQGYLGLTGDLPGYAAGTYPTLKSTGSYMYFSVGGVYSDYVTTGGSIYAVSSRKKKENFQVLDKQDILKKINALEMCKWDYICEPRHAPHIAPLAEDFYAKFGLGECDTMISHIDPAGIALVGVQALSQRMDELKSASNPGQITDIDDRVKHLETENDQLKSSNREQGEMINTLKAQIDAINQKLNTPTDK